MSAIYPLDFRWEGDVMRPLNPRAADRQYVVGQVYSLTATNSGGLLISARAG